MDKWETLYRYFAVNDGFGEEFATDVLRYSLNAKVAKGDITYEEACAIWTHITAPEIRKK